MQYHLNEILEPKEKIFHGSDKFIFEFISHKGPTELLLVLFS